MSDENENNHVEETTPPPNRVFRVTVANDENTVKGVLRSPGLPKLNDECRGMDGSLYRCSEVHVVACFRETGILRNWIVTIKYNAKRADEAEVTDQSTKD
jgi:hypothetical protein